MSEEAVEFMRGRYEALNRALATGADLSPLMDGVDLKQRHLSFNESPEALLDGQITPHRSISAGCFRWYFVGS